jgi:hypothetical protein
MFPPKWGEGSGRFEAARQLHPTIISGGGYGNFHSLQTVFKLFLQRREDPNSIPSLVRDFAYKKWARVGLVKVESW